MLTLREMMTVLYLEGGPHSATACAWLHEADDEDAALDLIELALDAYANDENDAAATVALIARMIGYPLGDGGDA